MAGYYAYGAFIFFFFLYFYGKVVTCGLIQCWTY